MAAVKRGRD